MASKAEVFGQLEALLPEGVVINSDDYTKKELEAMVALGARGESFDHLFKRRENGEEEEEGGRPGGRNIMIEDPALLEKVGATEPIPRQEYIRKRFEAGAHRREITTELGVVYQIVFAATKGMFNAHHTPGKRGGRSSLMIVVDDETGEETEMPRTEYIRREYERGRERSDIAKELGISYGLVYAATKDVERDEEVVAAYKRANADVESDEEADEDDTVDVEELEEELDEDDEALPEDE